MTLAKANREIALEVLVSLLKNTARGLYGTANYCGFASLTPEDEEFVYSRIFQCSSCGYWCDISDEYDNNVCVDCHQEEVEESGDEE